MEGAQEEERCWVASWSGEGEGVLRDRVGRRVGERVMGGVVLAKPLLGPVMERTDE